jgi:hypothetical protein
VALFPPIRDSVTCTVVLHLIPVRRENLQPFDRRSKPKVVEHPRSEPRGDPLDFWMVWSVRLIIPDLYQQVRCELSSRFSSHRGPSSVP